MFVWWNDLTAHRFGSVEKTVNCEKCGADYVYALFCEVTGNAISLFSLDNAGAARRAEARAEQKLQNALEHGVDVRPCPQCGHFQDNMIAKAREQILPWMNFAMMVLGLMCFLGAAFVLTILNGVLRDVGPVVRWDFFFEGLLAVGLLIAMAPILRWVVSLLYNPNRDSAAGRLKKGFFPGTLRQGFTEKRVPANLDERARGLLQQHHPLDNAEEKSKHLDRFLVRYLDGEGFAHEWKTLLRLSALLMRSKAIEYGAAGQPSKLSDYYLECSDLLERIYFDLFHESPRIDEPTWQPTDTGESLNSQQTAIRSTNDND